MCQIFDSKIFSMRDPGSKMTNLLTKINIAFRQKSQIGGSCDNDIVLNRLQIMELSLNWKLQFWHPVSNVASVSFQ